MGECCWIEYLDEYEYEYEDEDEYVHVHDYVDGSWARCSIKGDVEG